MYPLHEIQVAKGNGWRAGGWRELHALAMDSANEPYYLIMYSNVTQGYAVDIKRAQTYVVDFGSKVEFSNDNTVFGAKEETIVGPPDARIRRYSRVEIPLVTTNKYDNPYSNVQLYMEFRTPDGKTVSVPGFWDGDRRGASGSRPRRSASGRGAATPTIPIWKSRSALLPAYRMIAAARGSLQSMRNGFIRTRLPARMDWRFSRFTCVTRYTTSRLPTCPHRLRLLRKRPQKRLRPRT